jgi:hypothetical protein
MSTKAESEQSIEIIFRVVAFFALRKTRRRAQRQATESFANQNAARPQSDRRAVNVRLQRDRTHPRLHTCAY